MRLSILPLLLLYLALGSCGWSGNGTLHRTKRGSDLVQTPSAVTTNNTNIHRDFAAVQSHTDHIQTPGTSKKSVSKKSPSESTLKKRSPLPKDFPKHQENVPFQQIIQAPFRTHETSKWQPQKVDGRESKEMIHLFDPLDPSNFFGGPRGFADEEAFLLAGSPFSMHRLPLHNYKAKVYSISTTNNNNNNGERGEGPNAGLKYEIKIITDGTEEDDAKTDKQKYIIEDASGPHSQAGKQTMTHSHPQPHSHPPFVRTHEGLQLPLVSGNLKAQPVIELVQPAGRVLDHQPLQGFLKFVTMLLNNVGGVGNSPPEDEDDAIDYFYNNALDSIPPAAVASIPGHKSGRGLAPRMAASGKEAMQPLNYFEDEAGDDDLELRCPVHYQHRSALEGGNGDGKDDLIKVCSCRLYKKKHADLGSCGVPAI